MPTDERHLMATISVTCDGDRDEGWSCNVTVAEGGADIWTHRVRVSAADLARFASPTTEPDALVTASFAFLLERESAGSILRSFELAEIGRYFPEYEHEIRRATR
jgi:hypothetical protein